MKKLATVIVCAICLIATSCGNKSEKEIEQEISSGVVLVQNQSYYEMELPTGEKLYFSNYDEEDGIKGIAMDEDSVEVVTSYGTGFFISGDGQIATNAHVVSNTAEDKDITKSMTKILEAAKQNVLSEYKSYLESYREVESALDYAQFDDDVEYDDLYKLGLLKDVLEDKCKEYATIYNQLDGMKASDSEIRYHCTISVAYNDTYVTSSTDFVGCVITKTDKEHDLAILQLKDKKTPEDKHIFTVEEQDPLEEYSFKESITKKVSDDKNSKLFMASFNLGPTLALTKEGIKSQFNSGTISQRTGERLMYSIPTLPGSSGSPVVNLQGQLVAVNYAGLNGTQNFNYGIRVKYLRELIDK